MSNWIWWVLLWILLGVVSYIYWQLKLSALPFTYKWNADELVWKHTKWTVLSALFGPITWIVGKVAYDISTAA